MLALLALLQAAPPPSARLDSSFRPSADLELTRVRQLLRLPSGDILLVDQPGTEIYRLDSLGRQLAPLAREGAGPGEVKRVFGLGLTRDTVWIVDGVTQRLTYYTPQLTLLASQRYEERCGNLPWAILADGRCLVLIQRSLPPSVPDSIGMTMPLTLVGNGRVDTIAQWPLDRIRVRYADAESQFIQPFSDTPRFAWSANGRYYGWIGRRAIDPSQPARVAVEIHDLLTPKRVLRYTIPYTPQALPDQAVDSFLSQVKSPGRQWPGLQDSVRRRLYRPKWLPAITNASIRDDGSLWIREPPPLGAKVAIWRIFSTAGVETSRFAVPAGFAVHSISGARLLGVVTDEDDVPHLVQYLTPPTGS